MDFRNELSEANKKYKYTLSNITDVDAVNGLALMKMTVSDAGNGRYLLSFTSSQLPSTIEDYIHKELGLGYDNIERTSK